MQRPLRRSVLWPCQVVRERDFRLIARQIVDLSEAGMQVAFADRILTGEPVIVSFQAPFSRRWIDAEATVTRVVHGRRSVDVRGRCLGLHFDRIDGPAREFLTKELGWFRAVQTRARAQ